MPLAFMTLLSLNKLDTKTKHERRGKLQDSLRLTRGLENPTELQHPEPAVEEQAQAAHLRDARCAQHVSSITVL